MIRIVFSGSPVPLKKPTKSKAKPTKNMALIMDWRSGINGTGWFGTSANARNYNCFFHGSDRNPTWLSLTIHKISSSNSNALRRSRLDILDISSHRPTILTSVGIAASNAWAKGKTYSTSRASILIHFLQLSTGSIYVKIFRFKMMALVTDGNSDVFFSGSFVTR